MTPTMKLRFVEREVYVPVQWTGGRSTTEIKKVRILQQWFRHNPHPEDGEWIDVPLEEEEKNG